MFRRVFMLICSATALGQYVEVKEPPQDRAVLSGQSAELTCHIDHARSRPNHIVQWLSNSNRTGLGKPVSHNERITLRDMQNKFSISTAMPYNLLVQNVDIDDAGKYTCNDVRSGKPVGGIDPHLIVLEPALCPMLGISTFKENDIIKFTWSVRYAGHKDDSQKPTIKWTLNGIEQNATPDETTEGVFKSTITMAADSVDDQKELNCSFSVLDIKELCSTRLNIQYQARKPILLVKGDELETDRERLYFKEGSDVTLKGISQGNPTPSYTWQYEATRDVSYIYEETGDTKQIKGIRSSDAGVYRCCARNSLNGHRECSDLTIAVNSMDQVRSEAGRTSSDGDNHFCLSFLTNLVLVLNEELDTMRAFLRNLMPMDSFK